MVYTNIIQPLLGDFFDSDAILKRQRNARETAVDLENVSGTCSCCGIRRNNQQTQKNDANDNTELIPTG